MLGYPISAAPIASSPVSAGGATNLLVASASSQANASASLTTAVRLAAAANGQTSAGALLSTATRFIGGAVAQATAAAGLAEPGAAAMLSGAAVGDATAVASLKTGARFSGVANSVGMAAASLMTAVPLVGSAIGMAVADASLTTAGRLTGSAVSTALAGASLATAVRFAAQALAQATAAATVDRSATVVGERYVVGRPRRWDRGLVKLPVKAPDERFWIEFDFSDDLGASESIVAAQIGVVVYSGLDPNPALILWGDLLVDGHRVLQMLQGGLDGVVYRLACTAETTGDQILIRSCSLTVRSPLLH